MVKRKADIFEVPPVTYLDGVRRLDLNENPDTSVEQEKESIDNTPCSPIKGPQPVCQHDQTEAKRRVDKEREVEMSQQSVADEFSHCIDVSPDITDDMYIHNDMNTASIQDIQNICESNSPEENNTLHDLKNSDDDEKYILVSNCSTASSILHETEQLIPKESHNDAFGKLPCLANLKEIHSYVSINTVDDDSHPSIDTVDSLNDLSDSLTIREGHLTEVNDHVISQTEDDISPTQLHRSRTPSVDSTGDHCRVCHCRGDEVLIAPCHCNGSLKYVHESCLITWMKNPFKDSCEICKKKILIVKKRKPIYTWKWPLQRPTPLVWVIVFTTAICVNLMSVVKDATQKCVSTSCIIFYVIGSVGIILASMFLYFWVKRVKVFCESWKVQNEHWVVKIEDETSKVV